MRRIVWIAAAFAALALASPAGALAHGRHHGAHHARKHHRHAQRARLLRFGVPSTTAAPTSGAPTSPPAPPTPANAGKVLSFENEVLTIELADGTKVSGKVTAWTRLCCLPSTPANTPNPGDDDQGAGDDQGQQSGEHGGPPSEPGARGAWAADHQGGGDDNGAGDDDGAPPHSCTTTALTAGAVVREAELSVGGSGAIWERVALIQ